MSTGESGSSSLAADFSSSGSVFCLVKSKLSKSPEEEEKFMSTKTSMMFKAVSQTLILAFRWRTNETDLRIMDNLSRPRLSKKGPDPTASCMNSFPYVMLVSVALRDRDKQGLRRGLDRRGNV